MRTQFKYRTEVTKTWTRESETHVAVNQAQSSILAHFSQPPPPPPSTSPLPAATFALFPRDVAFSIRLSNRFFPFRSGNHFHLPSRASSGPPPPLSRVPRSYLLSNYVHVCHSDTGWLRTWLTRKVSSLAFLCVTLVRRIPDAYAWKWFFFPRNVILGNYGALHKLEKWRLVGGLITTLITVERKKSRNDGNQYWTDTCLNRVL